MPTFCCRVDAQPKIYADDVTPIRPDNYTKTGVANLVVPELERMLERVLRAHLAHEPRPRHAPLCPSCYESDSRAT